MDVDSDPVTTWGPAGLCQEGTNRSLNYFWTDGSIYIRPEGSSTIYLVWETRLSKYSKFFAVLTRLPLVVEATSEPSADGAQPNNPSKKPTTLEVVRKRAEESGGDGNTEANPLWVQATALQLEVFFECVFTDVTEEILKTRPVAFWEIAIQMADFFDSPTVTQIAMRHLDMTKGFDPAMRLSLAMQYEGTDWIPIAFDALLQIPLPELSLQQIQTMGFSAYIILAETHSKITKHRILCALSVPDVVHDSECSDKESCTKSWSHTWWGEAVKHGVAVALIHPKRMPAANIIKALPHLITSWHMSSNCRMLTTEDLAKPTSLLMEEYKIIANAVRELKRF